MNDRFPVLHFLAGFVSFLFGASLAGGVFLFLMLAQPPQARADVFGQIVPEPAIVAFGTILTLSGLLGLLMAGAVRVLLAIEQSVRKSVPN